jgi:hypothetical protein
MILASAKQSSIRVMNEYGELLMAVMLEQISCQETGKFLLTLYHSAVVTLHIYSFHN